MIGRPRTGELDAKAAFFVVAYERRHGIAKIVQPIVCNEKRRVENCRTELLRRGYGDEDVRKILGKNILRVMRKAEAVAASMARSP